MATVKLTADSPKPAEVAGRLQLFGSDYNPFSQRIHMVLISKDIPHDVFEVSPGNKPAWLADMQKDHRPVVIAEGKVLNTDQDILKYIADKFPSQTRQQPGIWESNMELLKKFEPVTDNFVSALRDKDHKPSEKVREFFKAFEDELEKRGTTFLGGENAGSVDYMIWPWVERFRVPFVLHGVEHKPNPNDKFPHKFIAWREAMEKTKAVTQTKHTVEEHVELAKKFTQK